MPDPVGYRERPAPALHVPPCQAAQRSVVLALAMPSIALAVTLGVAFLVAVAGARGPALSAAEALRPTVPHDPKRLEIVADSLRLAGQVDSSVTLARAFRRQALERGDTVATVRAYLVECHMHTYRGRAAEGEQAARAALRLARAVGDSARARESLLEVGITLDAQGRAADATAFYRQVGELSADADDRANYARARMYLGRMANNQGRFADAHRDLVFARAVFDSLRLTRDELNASNILGIALFSLMDLEGAAECFRHCAELGRQLGNPAIEGRGLNNLARVKYSQGDQDAAERYADQAMEIQRATGDVRSLTIAMLNVGEARARLGRYTEAVAVIEEARALAQEHDLHSTVCSAHANLGFTRWLEGRNAQSAAHYREAIAQARGWGLANEEVNALLGIARALSSQDSVAAAYELLASRAGALRGKVEPAWELQLDDHLASFLTSMGRHREAIPIHRDVERRAVAGGLINFRVITLANLAESYAALGMPDSALAALQRGERVWESQRALPVDPRWREERGAAGRQLYERMAKLLLEYPTSATEEERARRAFDALQAFKARTLLERMLGPGVAVAGSTSDSASSAPRPPALPVTLAELQHGVLEAGELLLDCYAGSSETVIFAVTRSVCRAHRLPEASVHLGEKLDVLRGLMDVDAAAAATRDPAAVEQACRAAGRVLLAPVADLVAASRQVVFAADGPLNLAAVAALIPPAPQGGRSLVADTELVRVPSATVLARLRRSGRGGPAWGSGAVALSALPTSPASASPPTPPSPTVLARNPAVLALAGEVAGEFRLPGAIGEVRGLGRRYRGVEVRIGSQAEAAIRDPRTLSAYDVLHVAAHAEVDDENPWRSGIVLAPAEAAPDAKAPRPQPADAGATPGPVTASRARGLVRAGDGAAALRAASIAALSLRARLVVLSACNSAGGRVVSGEGVLGLTGAFLAAGVPTVVATLWPVDDRTAARLMEHFYRHLAQGASAAAALREAQLAMQSDAATRDPFYWAGFVLVGDGDTRVPLRRRAPPWVTALAIVSVAAVFALASRQMRRDV